LSEGVFESVYIAGCAGTDGDEGVGLGGEDLLGEQARGGVGHVGFAESHGLEATFQGLQDPGTDRLLDDQHHP
jgi:hypothetical protein